jgi:hemoglobin
VFKAVHVDWSAHIPRLVDFWSWQLLGERGYDGHPIRAHQPANELVPFSDAHFRRWLEIFDSTVDDLFAGPTAELAKHRAAKIARAMRRSLGDREPGGAPEARTGGPRNGERHG